MCSMAEYECSYCKAVFNDEQELLNHFCPERTVREPAKDS